MKILYILLLATGPAYGQAPLPPFSLTPKLFLRPGLQKDANPVRISGNRVSIRRPDNMPCLIPDLAQVERMPIRKLSNTGPIDPMPNAVTPDPAFWKVKIRH